MIKYAVCIPTLNQYDTIVKNINAIKQSNPPPEVIFVVDNGGALAPLDGVEMIRPRKNLGVASSWNLLIKLSTPLKPVILNDDLLPSPTVCGALAASESAITSLAGEGYSAFSINLSCYENVGLFDEAIWPAYLEDNDYDWRIHLAGFSHKIISGECTHSRSSTISSLAPQQRKAFRTAIRKNKQYYIKKWGGGPRAERFITPFGHSGTGDLLSENDIRKGQYIRACTIASDINEHLPTLCRYSQSCHHITLFGAANSAIAFLDAQPETLVIYDTKPLKSLRHLELIAGKTKIKIVQADTREVDIEQTDFLFIDSYHSAAYLTSELEKSFQKVRQFIGFHDTVTYGETGQYGELGIMYSLRPFLACKPQWHVLCEDRNNNGLIIIGRRN